MQRNIILLGIIMLLCLSSCKTFYPNVMFKTPEDYNYVDLDTVPAPEYIIKPGDRLTFSAYTNLGIGQISTIVPTFGGGSGNANISSRSDGVGGYLIRHDGTVELPIVGAVNLQGYSVPQAQEFLKEKLSIQFREPVVQLGVTNRRVYIYTSGGGSGSVLELVEENLKLIEVITMAGGVGENAKAFRVKVFRGDMSDPMVGLYDLSTLEGIQKADIIILPDDIIYIEEQTKFVAGLLREASPYLGLIGTLTSLVSLFYIYTRTSDGN